MNTTMSKIRTYSGIVGRSTLEDRFEYLRLDGIVGRATFGFDREINQRFYRSREWKDTRDFVIVRDNGCDLGVPGHEIHTALLVHHINPISIADLDAGLHWILDPEYLITTCHDTHNAIHYGDISLLPKQFVERSPGDTKLW